MSRADSSAFTILIYTIPATGHVFAMLSLMKALVEHNNQVIVYSSQAYQRVIEETGAVYKQYPFDDRTIDLRDGSRILKFRRLILQYTVEMMPFLLTEATKYSPNYIIHDAAAHWGYRVAQYKQIPAASFCSFITISHWHSIAALQYARHFLLSSLKDSKELYVALPLMKTLKTTYHFKKFSIMRVLLNHQNLNIISYPKQLQPGGQDFDDHYFFLGPCSQNRKTSHQKDDLIRKGKRRCYISLGTIMNDNKELFQHFIQQLINTDFDVYISDGAGVVTIPKEFQDRFMVRRFFDQQQLLQHMDVFLCSCGINSVCESIIAGVPTLLFPQQGEQKICGLKVQQLGFGIIANPKQDIGMQIEQAIALKQQWNTTLAKEISQLRMQELLVLIKQDIKEYTQ